MENGKEAFLGQNFNSFATQQSPGEMLHETIQKELNDKIPSK